MTELLLEGQWLCTFLQLKTAVTKKVLVGDAQVPMGVTEESYAMTISKFKATAFKKYAARYQVSYTHTKVYVSLVVWQSGHIPQD